nr:TlpA disulfide reductase family protein [Caldalkalibacillus salinus]
MGSQEVKAEVGFQAPSFFLEHLHTGEEYSLDSTDKPVLINFWASWCGPCKLEAPDMVKVYEEYGEHIDIYAINLTDVDDIPQVESFVEEYGFTFPVLLDEEGKVADQYNVMAIPTTFVVNSEGEVTAKHQGYATMDDLIHIVSEVVEES